MTECIHSNKIILFYLMFAKKNKKEIPKQVFGQSGLHYGQWHKGYADMDLICCM